jgi:hypothetical protein
MDGRGTLGGGWAAHALGSLTFPNMRSRSRVPPGMGLTIRYNNNINSVGVSKKRGRTVDDDDDDGRR